MRKIYNSFIKRAKRLENNNLSILQKTRKISFKYKAANKKNVTVKLDMQDTS